MIAAVSAFVGAAAAASAPDGASAPPTTDPTAETRPTIPPLTAPPAAPSTSAPAAEPTVPTTTGGATDLEPGSHDSDDPVAGPGLVSPAARPAVLAAFDLDEEQLACVAASFTPAVTDEAATAAVLDGCGVSAAALVDGAVSVWQRGQELFDAGPTTTGSPDELSVHDAFVVSMLFLAPPDGFECLAPQPPAASDAEAVEALEACGMTLSGIVTGLELALVGVTPPSAPTVPGEPSVTTVPGPPATDAPVVSGAPDDDAGVTTVQELFDDQGISLDAEQAACVLAGLATVDLDDMSSIVALLDGCQVF